MWEAALVVCAQPEPFLTPIIASGTITTIVTGTHVASMIDRPENVTGPLMMPT